jgi:hypothetical protein
MGEHTFDREDPRDPRAAMLDRVFELAERLLEEVSRARQDWAAVVAMSGELAALALRLDRRCGRRQSPAKQVDGPLSTQGGALYHRGPEDRHLHEDL